MKVQFSDLSEKKINVGDRILFTHTYSGAGTPYLEGEIIEF
jgi:hypothetical protein